MAETQVADALVGTLVDGRYRVRDRVARGGMATVYTAVDERLERTVALKMIHPQQAQEPRFVERFIDEAKAVARLTHPNVVAAYDQGSHQGSPYLVMEYVRGRTLRELLRQRGNLGPVEALSIVEQMLAAIAAAHRAGLVHRDIKPENVLVTESPSGGATNLVDSVVKVTDFGLAQAVEASAHAAGDTEGGGMMATAAYVAPELVTGEGADPRSDVYSTGVVLYEMLTGRVPYDGASAQVAWRHVDEDVPPPSQYVPELPGSIDELTLRATRRDRSQRPTDAGALLSQVQILREKITTSSVPRAARAADDATMVISRLTAPERPSWARLPQHRGRTTGARRHTSRESDPNAETRVVAPTSGGHRTTGTRRAAVAAGPRRRALLAGAAVALVLVVAVGGWWFGFGRWMPAPELTNMPESEAVSQAEQQGLEVAFAEPRHSDQVPDGHVLAQDPTDRVVRGGTVTLTLSLGPEIVTVPDVVGAELPVATRKLEELGLMVVEADPDYNNTVPEGRVVTVAPPVGEEVEPGTEVTVTASRGRAPIDVPAVVGMPLEQARAHLRNAGLEVAVERVRSESPEGQVLTQDPAAQTGAESGETVTLEVSEGPPERPVPDLDGQECEDVEEILEEAGFEARFVPPTPRGEVRGQDPGANKPLTPGEAVTVFCL